MSLSCFGCAWGKNEEKGGLGIGVEEFKGSVFGCVGRITRWECESEREQRERERAEGVVEEEKEMAKGRVPRGMGWWDTEIYTCTL